MGEKTEKATPKKLRDARKKGQVAKTKDFPSAFTFIVAISSVLFLSNYLYDNLCGFLLETFTSIKKVSPTVLGGLSQETIEIIFKTSIPIMVAVSLMGVIVNFLIIGPLFAMEAMKPDMKRLNPVTNIKNIFKIKTLVELIKSLLKILGALVIIFFVVYMHIDEIAACCGRPVIISALVFGKFLKEVVIGVGIFFIAVGILDLIFQRRTFANEMKMEKFEVKQEYKDTEGDPNIKRKRRQTAQEIAYQDGPGAASRARAIVTNPSHIAVALGYDKNVDPAPKILTMGLDGLAQKIIKVAQDHNVPIIRNVELSHTLYYDGEIGAFVPEKTYAAIAEVLKWIAKIEDKYKDDEMLEKSIVDILKEHQK